MNYSLDSKKLVKATSLKNVRREMSDVFSAPKKPQKLALPPNQQTPAIQPQKNNGDTSTQYTDDDVRRLLADGYISVHPTLWDYIPAGAHIRYIKRDDGNGKSRAERFKPGGFVRNHFSAGEKKLLIVETRPGGKRDDVGYISFPLAYEDLAELWKKYDKNTFIETHLIYTSLAQKKKQIEDLQSRVDKLEGILRAVVQTNKQ